MRFAIVIITLLVSVPAYAQQQQPDTVGLTADQIQLIRSNLKGIYDVMGVPKTADGKPAQAQEQDQKTMVDVADKALNLMSGLVIKVAGTLEQVAPKFWAIMVRQQYAKALADTVVPCSLTVFFFTALAFMRKRLGWPDIDAEYWRDQDWVRFWFALIVPAVAFFVSFWASVASIADAAKYVINPEYYAVRDILLMFTRPGSM